MAGKRKNPADNWMPPRVYQAKRPTNSGIKITKRYACAHWMRHDQPYGWHMKKRSVTKKKEILFRRSRNNS